MKIRNGYVSNSSSSSFICKTDLTTREVKKELEKMLNHMGAIMGEEYDYNDVFGSIGEVEEPVNEPESWYLEYEGEYIQKNFAESDIIIRSSSDNTIPYYMFEIIEEKFDAFRIHRG